MSSESTGNETMKIDLRVLSSDFLKTAKRLLWLGILLALLCSSALSFWTYRSYTPRYQATASFTIYVTNPLLAEVRTYNSATAEQMANTFPYILTSGALSEVVMQDLGLSYMPSVSASALKNTNIFTLTVTSGDPQLAYDVLNSVIAHYPEVAEFVVGPTVMTLLDESGVPTQPVNSPNYASAIKKGVLIGAALWAGILLLLSFARSTIHNEAELKQLGNMHCIGTLPMVKGFQRKTKGTACPLLTMKGENYGFSESIRLLRIRTEKEMREHNGKVLLVSSAIPGEGKTTVASNLAIALAQKGSRVLLVDCDLRNPSVEKVFGEKEPYGLSAYLRGAVTAKNLIRQLGTNNLFAIFAGEAVSGASELLAKKEAKNLINAARNIFDVIILDTPPCSMLADASEVAALADCAMLTIRQDYASKDQILEGAQLLSDGGLPLIGCVMNCVRHDTFGGSYGYYGYGYGYSQYYKSYGEGTSKHD